MGLAAGTRLGAYQILAPLGAGGMGEVYRALDTRLGREVAVKVVSERLMADSAALARFEREARTVAALSHPNIVALFDVGRENGLLFAVMELLQGESLERYLATQKLSWRQALAIGVSIADGLASAHARGLVHRDLKPANVFITHDGLVKLLDFGLAKEDPFRGSSHTGAPRGSGDTEPGAVVGTITYMSPERVKGEAADHRSDIFSFGCVLYEMLAGYRPFPGDTPAETLAAVLRDQPLDLVAAGREIPARVDGLVRRCLEKDPEHRFQSARDLSFALHEVLNGSQTTASNARTVAGRVEQDASLAEDALPERPGVAEPALVVTEGDAELGPNPTAALGRRSRRWFFPSVVLVSLASLILGWTMAQISRPSTVREIIHLAIPIPDTPLQLVGYAANVMAVSPDGKWVAFVSNGADGDELYLRDLSSGTQRKLFTNQGAEFHPFFSPDSEWVCFAAGGRLFKAPVRGGEPTVITAVPKTFRGGSWGDNGYIVFSPASKGALARVRADGGVSEPVTTLNVAVGETNHRTPWVLPGSKAMLYVVQRNDRSVGDIWCLRFHDKHAHRLIEGASLPEVVRGHYLVYLQQGKIMVVRLDPTTLTLEGAPVMIRASVQRYGISDAGTLIYAAGGKEPQSRPVWVDRHGRETGIPAPPGRFANPAISPDGSHFVVSVNGPFTRQWLYDINRGEGRQLAGNEGNSGGWFTWTPDGRRLTYALMGSKPEAGYDILWRPADGGPDEPLVELPETQRPGAWSPDGNTLAFIQEGEQGGMWFFSQSTAKSHRARWATGHEFGATFSPDGQWIAYASDDTGRQQVYVRRADESGDRTQISINSGGAVRWGANGTELFFRSGHRVIAVPVHGGSPISFGSPAALFEDSSVPSDGVGPNYDVTPDGQRFLMIKPEPGSSAPSQIDVVLGWVPELERLVNQ